MRRDRDGEMWYTDQEKVDWEKSTEGGGGEWERVLEDTYKEVGGH